MLNRIQFYISRGVFTVKNSNCTHQELNSQPCHGSHMTKNSQYPTAPYYRIIHGKVGTLYNVLTSTFLKERRQTPTLNLASTTTNTLFFLNHHHRRRPPINTASPRSPIATTAHNARRPPTTTTVRHNTTTTTQQRHVTNQTSTGELDTTGRRVV